MTATAEASAFRVAPAPTNRRKPALLVAGGLAGLLLLGWGVHAWRYASTHVETDNATLAGHIHVVSARVAGTVTAVLVDDNQAVRDGQLLVRLDPRDFEVRLQEARAARELAAKKASLAEAGVAVADGTAQGKQLQARGTATTALAAAGSLAAGVDEAKAQVAAMEAQLVQARSNQARSRADLDRADKLYAAGGLSQQALESIRNGAETDAAKVSAAQETLAQARARVRFATTDALRARAQAQASQGDAALASTAGLQAGMSRLQLASEQQAVAQADAQVQDAALQLSYARIDAPVAGRVGRKVVEVGARVQPGQALLAVVEPELWVVANFKETQVEHMRPGQKAEIKLDAFPSKPLEAEVESLAPASGAQFSLLPPDNATGNFTKVVQRVPVKLRLRGPAADELRDRLAPGMSAEVSVAL